MEKFTPEEIIVSKELGENLDKIVEQVRTNPDLAFIGELEKEFEKGQIFLVGGAVRDALLGKELKDFDFIVRGISKSKLETFLAKHGTVKDVESRTFGVYKFYPAHTKEEDRGRFAAQKGEPRLWREPIEIALPRTERQTGEGYKDFEVKSDPDLPLEEDLSRRDFTINAIALDIKAGVLIDPHEGIRDIQSRRIKAVGEPKDRFDEDPSRMLRAMRFAAQLNFDIEKSTWSAIKKKIGEVNAEYYKGSPSPTLEKVELGKKGKSVERVAREVVAREFLKGFDSDPIKTLELYESSGAMAVLFPEFVAMRECDQPKNFHSEGDVFEHAKLALNKLADLKNEVKKAAGLDLEFPELSAELKLAVLLHDIGKPAAKTWKEEYGRHVFYGHDTMGAEIADSLIDRLKLTVYPKEHPLHIDKDKMHWLIKNHLFALNTDIAKVSLNALKKRFFRDDDWGDYLLALAWSDSLASIKDDGKPQLEKILDLTKRIEELKKEFGETKKPEPLLLNGHEIMEILGLKKGGPEIGLALEVVSELQLEKKIKDKDEIAQLIEDSSAEIKKGDRVALASKLKIRLD